MSSGVEISWRDVEVAAPLSRTELKHRKKNGLSVEDKVIIPKMSGSIRPGELTAILGPSGCGKTTFMNVLSRRSYFIKKLNWEGQIFLNGHPIEEIDYNSAVGYVMQDDIILPIFTVREVLEFTAKLTLPDDKSQVQVDNAIRDLSLRSCQDTRVGSDLVKGISGGEKKRTSIAIEMLTNPIVLFLDEPTTGLDSHNSENLIDVLNELAEKKKVTIVSVIHQPNSFLFSKFTNLILMGAGKIYYNGPGAEAIDYFAQLGYKCPKYTNPAEFLLELVTPAEDDPDKLDRLYSLVHVPPEPSFDRKDLPSFEHRRSAGFCRQLGLLGKKVFLNIIRNQVLFYFKWGANLFFALLVLLAFFQVAGDNDDALSVLDRAGTLMILMVFIAFVSINAAAAYADEKAMFIREQSSKMYSAGAYYLSKLLFESPLNLLITAVVAILCYLEIGYSLQTPEQIFIFTLITLLVNLAALGWGNFLIMSIPNTEAAIAAAPFILILQFLVGGLLINFDDIPVYLVWLEYISLFKYSWTAAMLNEFDTFDENDCGPEDVCDAKDFYNLELSLWENIGVIAGLTAGVHLLAFIMLARLARSVRT